MCIKSNHPTVLALNRYSHFADLQNCITPSTTEPDDTCNRRAELDTMPADQGVWSALEDLEGLGAWDGLWDNDFGFLTPLDS